MILLTRKANVLVGEEAEFYMTEKDLELLVNDESIRGEFLTKVNSEFLQVNPLVLVDSELKQFKIPVVKVEAPPKVKWGCSHSLSGV